MNDGERKVNRIQSLEAMRVFMMCLVFISHLEFLSFYSYGDFYNSYLHNANLAVDFFFVMSGFGMMNSYLAKSNNKIWINPLKFALDKIKKIYPVYLISILIALPYTLYLSVMDNGVIKAIIKTGVKFIMCMSLTQSLLGKKVYSHAINGVAWFLSALFIVYLISPIVMKAVSFSKKKIFDYIGIIVTGIIAITMKIGFLRIEGITNFDDLSYGFPVLRLFYVVLGMWIAKLYISSLKKGVKKKENSLSEITICLLSIIWIAARNNFQGGNILKFSIDLMVSGGIIACFSRENGIISNILTKSKILQLSKYTMYVYMLHYPIRIYVDLLFENNRYLLGGFSGILESVIVLIITAAFSVVIYKRVISLTKL